MDKQLIYAAGSFSLFGLVLSLVMGDIGLSIILVPFMSIIGSLFILGFMIRLKKKTPFEVNLNNIDKNKSLRWYEDEIRVQLKMMRYKLVEKDGDVEKFKPAFGYDMYEPIIEIDFNMYYISIKGSPLIKRTLSDILDIKF